MHCSPQGLLSVSCSMLRVSRKRWMLQYQLSRPNSLRGWRLELRRCGFRRHVTVSECSVLVLAYGSLVYYMCMSPSLSLSSLPPLPLHSSPPPPPPPPPCVQATVRRLMVVMESLKSLERLLKIRRTSLSDEDLSEVEQLAERWK